MKTIAQTLSSVLLCALLLLSPASSRAASSSPGESAPQELYVQALRHFTGLGAEQNTLRGFQFLLQAASTGHVEAEFELGHRYESDTGSFHNTKAAARWYEKAAHHGHAEAAFRLAGMLLTGAGSSLDLDIGQGIRELEAAARLNHAKARSTLLDWDEFCAGKQADLALCGQTLQQQAESGDATAMFDLAELFEYGLGVPEKPELAIAWYERGARAGDPDAMAALAWQQLYDHQGRFFESNEEAEAKALELFTEAAALGNAEALAGLGWCHETGIGIKINHAKAIQYYKKAAAMNHCGAMLQLGGLSLAGIGMERDTARGLDWIARSAALDCHEAQAITDYWNSRLINGASNPAAELEALMAAGESGDPDAQCTLADMYYLAEGLPENYHFAMGLYELAADQGHAEAQYSLGEMYYYGDGVDPDDEQAAHYYRLAAEQGHAEAQYSLAWLLSESSPPLGDPKEARDWYDKAASQGHSGAQYQLAELFTDNDTLFDPTQAVHWFSLAAESGLAAAQFRLGKMYESGQGVPQDESKAADWYLLAAEQNLAPARCALAKLYQEGRGVEKSASNAAIHYALAAEQGSTTARLELARMYLTGAGTPKNLLWAFYWADLAASTSDPSPTAITLTLDIARQITPETLSQAKQMVREARN